MIIDVADRGGAVILLEPGASAPVISTIRRLAAARHYELRAPHYSLSASSLTDEAARAIDGLLLLDDADELSALARRKLVEFLESSVRYGGGVPVAIFATVDTAYKDEQGRAQAETFAQELGDALGIEVLVADGDGRMRGLSPLGAPQAKRDLAEINRHRASIYQAPLDPVAAGWGPEDLAAEVRRIRALNPTDRAKERLLAW